MGKYGITHLDSLVGGCCDKRGSQWWCDLMSVCEIFENGLGWFQKRVKRTVGVGREVRFWDAKWVGEEALCTTFNRLYSTKK